MKDNRKLLPSYPIEQCILNLFTAQERKALLFLLVAGLLGWGLRACQKESAYSWETARAPERRVSVNRAAEAELVALPGVGPVIARRVVEARQKQGRFLTLKDLLRVKGITTKTLERLNGWVSFD